MTTNLHNIAVRASLLGIAALSFSTPLFGANGSDNVVQSIVTPVIPTWIEVPVLVSTALVPAPPPTPTPAPAPTPAPSTPLKPGDTGYVKPKDVVIAQPAAAPAPPPAVAPPAAPAAPETEYLPPKSARN